MYYEYYIFSDINKLIMLIPNIQKYTNQYCKLCLQNHLCEIMHMIDLSYEVSSA